MKMRLGVMAVFLSGVLLNTAATEKQFVLQDYLGHTWQHELVHYDVGPFEAGEATPDHLVLRGPDGTPVPFQLENVRLHDDKSVKSARIWFFADLPAKGKSVYTLSFTNTPLAGPKTDLVLREEADAYVIENPQVGIRLLKGQTAYNPSIPARKVPAPFSRIKRIDGKWMGRGWFDSDEKVHAYTSEILAQGPIFSEVRIRYDFGGNRHYTVTVRVLSGEPAVFVREQYNLGKRETYFFHDRAPAYRRSWHAKGFLKFSVYDGFEPDRVHLEVHNPLPEQCLLPGTRGEKPNAKKYGLKLYAIDYSHPPQEYPRTVLDPHLERVIHPWWNWGGFRGEAKEWVGLFNSENEKAGYLAVLSLKGGSDWELPMLNGIRMHSDPPPDKDYYMVLSLNYGKRYWAFLNTTKEKGYPPKGFGIPKVNTVYYARREQMTQATTPARLAMIRYAENPLDEIKDKVFTWKSVTPYPRLYCDKGDMPAIRARIEKYEPWKKAIDNQLKLMEQGHGKFARLKDGYVPDRHFDLLGIYLATGNRDCLRSMYRVLEDNLNTWIAQALGSSGHQFLGLMHMGDALVRLVPYADFVLGSDLLSEEETTDLKAKLAFIAHVQNNPVYVPLSDRETFGRGSLNQGFGTYTSAAKWACLFPQHPDAKEWLDRGLREMRDIVALVFAPDGSYMENPCYMERPYIFLLTANAALIHNHLPSLMNDPKLFDAIRERHMWYAQKYGEPLYRNVLMSGLYASIKLLTPPNPRFNGQRINPDIGDAKVDAASIMYLPAANMLKDIEPKRSRELMWAWRQAGQRPFSIPYMYVKQFYDFLLCDPFLPEESPELKSVFIPGWGAVLRSGFGTTNETALFYHHGRHSWGHYHDDMGSFIFLYKNRPVSLDFSPKYRGYRHQTPWMHNKVSFDWKKDKSAGDMRPTGIEHFVSFPDADYLWGERYVDRLVSEPRNPYDVYKGWKPTPVENVPVSWWHRHILFMRDEDPSGYVYFVIGDATQSPLPTQWSIWIAATEHTKGKGRVSFKGTYGADTELIFSNPDVKMTTDIWGWLYGPNYRGSKEPAMEWYAARKKANPKRAAHPKSEEQTVVRIEQKPNTSRLALVFPHLPSEIVPAITPIKGKGFKLVFPDQTHYVFVSPEFKIPAHVKAPDFAKADDPWELSRYPFNSQSIRKAITFAEGKVRFRGKAGAVKLTAGKTSLYLFEAGTIEANGVKLNWSGPSAMCECTDEIIRVRTRGAGKLILAGLNLRNKTLRIDEQIAFPIHRRKEFEMTFEAGDHELVLQASGF